MADGLLPGQWLHAVGDGCRFAPHCTTMAGGVPSTWRLKEAGDGGAASEGVRCSFMDCASIITCCKLDGDTFLLPLSVTRRTSRTLLGRLLTSYFKAFVGVRFAATSLFLFVCCCWVCVCVCVCARVHACVCVCVCARAHCVLTIVFFLCVRITITGMVD